MARQVSDREDLLRDGTQMPVRGRCMINGCEVFIGFRSQGQASLYWEQDPVYQFNSDNELRRVFFNGHRYAAHNRLLARLTSSKTSELAEGTSHLSLSRIPVSAEMTQTISNRFVDIKAQLLGETHVWECIGVDTSAEFNERVKTWLLRLGCDLAIASSPNA